jgi:hypothetical protein
MLQCSSVALYFASYPNFRSTSTKWVMTTGAELHLDKISGSLQLTLYFKLLSAALCHTAFIFKY